MVLVDYIKPTWGKPDQRYFRCQPMAATLATEACGSNWRASHEPGAERLLSCRVCPIGAVHAGETDASLSPLRGTKTCSRCALGTTRLIGGWLCVSCYNREREMRIGRNARGKAPSCMPPLMRRTLCMVEAGGLVKRLSRGLTMDTEELMVAALRDSDRTVRFCFNGRASAHYAQEVLF